MKNFYDEWLGLWDGWQEECAKARKFIHEEDLEWVRTKQDYKAALICGRENGFITAGALMTAIIPKGWHTGMHSHGEEAMFIMEGEGFSVVDDKRYDWEKHSALFMPFGSEHQHFNTGDGDVRYVSGMGIALEKFAGVAKVMQYEEAGEIARGEIDQFPKAESDVHPEYGRIVLHVKDAPVIAAKDWAAETAKRTDEFAMGYAKEMRTAGMPGHHVQTVELMGHPQNEFKAKEVEFTHLMSDSPGNRTGKHAHMEALVYFIHGQGYSIVDNEKIQWKKGTLVHVQGPQTVHQHFPTGDENSQSIRIHYGLRANYFQKIARRTFPYKYYELSSY